MEHTLQGLYGVDAPGINISVASVSGVHCEEFLHLIHRVTKSFKPPSYASIVSYLLTDKNSKDVLEYAMQINHLGI